MPAITTTIRDALASSLTHDLPLAGRFERRSNNVLAFFRAVAENAFNPYRPERHYMRGPGPAWRRKHGANRPAA